jgi:Rrf2 family protein
MKVSSRFSMAVQALMVLGAFQEKKKVTGDLLAVSIDTSPALVRRIISQLKGAGLVKTVPGTGGTFLARAPQEITLLEIYRAVADQEDGIFNFHPHPNPICPVGRNIHAVLGPRLERAQQAMEDSLAQDTLADLLEDLYQYKPKKPRPAGTPGAVPESAGQTGTVKTAVPFEKG